MIAQVLLQTLRNSVLPYMDLGFGVVWEVLETSVSTATAKSITCDQSDIPLSSHMLRCHAARGRIPGTASGCAPELLYVPRIKQQELRSVLTCSNECL